MLYPSSAFRWLQRKRYQYEVTFSLYMLTPTEKFILNSILFLVLSLSLIGLWYYLPEHISVMWRRVLYYAAGDAAPATTASTVNAVGATGQAVKEILREGAATAREL